jgi:ribonuclease VapC
MSSASSRGRPAGEIPVVVLDSFALVALLRAEPGAATVQEALAAARREDSRAVLSLISLTEAAYIEERRHGIRHAQTLLSAVQDLPLEVAGVDLEAALAAAHVKAGHAISLADAFVVALATRVGGTILTGDPEFKSVEDMVPIEWLPAR